MESNNSPLCPYAREHFLRDVVETLLLQIRALGWITNPKTAWQITGKPFKLGFEYLLFEPRNNAAALGLAYEDVAQTTFARVLEAMYQVACFGVIEESQEEMYYESKFTWVSSILCDLSNSSFAVDFCFDWEGVNPAHRCKRVAELANARRVLEGLESFYCFAPSSTEQDEGYREYPAEVQGLTLHQMALLAGVEEMDICVRAEPESTSPLATFSANGRTLVAREVAREWLKLEGMYVPVRRTEGKEGTSLA